MQKQIKRQLRICTATLNGLQRYIPVRDLYEYLVYTTYQHIREQNDGAKVYATPGEALRMLRTLETDKAYDIVAQWNRQASPNTRQQFVVLWEQRRPYFNRFAASEVPVYFKI